MIIIKFSIYQALTVQGMDFSMLGVGKVMRKAEEGRGLKKKGENRMKSDQESFEPEYHQIKKMGFKVSKYKITVGEWNYQENQVYLQFMIDNLADFLSEKSRRKTKVFFRLSKILKRRTPDQCRSHHQKLQLKYKDDLYSIIGQVYRKIQKSIAQEYVDYQHRLHVQNINKYKELSRTDPEEDVIADKGELKDRALLGEWFAIVQKQNHFRITIQEQDVATWQAEH